MKQIVWLLCSTVLLQLVSSQTPLDDYINLPDDSYTYSFLGSYRDEVRGVTVYDLNMTSQTWFDESFSSRPVWFHYMAMVVPDVVRYQEHSVLFISWGSNNDDPPTVDNDDYLPLVMDMAAQGGMVATLLNQVPNQPTLFADDEKQENRSEDDAIAFTWRLYAEQQGADPNVLLLFPMTKAAIRAMDTVQDAAQIVGLNIGQFLVTGGSKRGWTTYLAAATDPQQRVFAIMPLVYSVLNMPETLMRHYQAMGGWSWAMQPYYDEDLTPLLTTEIAEQSMNEWDPYVFRDRLTMPKLLVSGTGDEFFFPHESHEFFDDLIGPKFYLMLENTNHFLLGHESRIVSIGVAFALSIIEGFPLPQLSWQREFSDDGLTGTLRLQTDQTPVSVTRWTTTTTEFTEPRRDFRLLYLSRIGLTPNPILWTSEPEEANSDGDYTVTYDIPETGWRGVYLTVAYSLFDGLIFETTTEVHILPGDFPNPVCEGVECTGELV